MFQTICDKNTLELLKDKRIFMMNIYVSFDYVDFHTELH